MTDKHISLAAAKATLHEIVETIRQDARDPVLARMTEVLVAGAIERLERLPEVEAAPVVHGRWENRGFFGHNCSHCGALNDIDTNFCSNCGAKMMD